MPGESQSLASIVTSIAGQIIGLNPGALEKKFKAREIYQGCRVEPPLALRLDGVGWGRRLRDKYEWPRDERVHRALVAAAVRLLEEFNTCCGLVVSDEVSVIINNEPPYGGRVEKLVSVSAGLVSATISRVLGEELYVDSRIVKLYGASDAAEYLLHRVRVGFNNYVSSIYHSMVPGGKGHTPSLPEMLQTLREQETRPSLWEPWRLLGTCIARTQSLRVLDDTAAERRRIIAIDASPSLCKKAIDSTLGRVAAHRM